jgi:hypothetical protein
MGQGGKERITPFGIKGRLMPTILSGCEKNKEVVVNKGAV